MHRRFGIALLLVAVLGLADCKSSTAPAPFEPFVVRVDSIGGFTAFSGGRAFDVQVWAVVGPTSCYRFKKFDTVRATHRLDVTVMGERRTDAVDCLQVLTELRGTPLRVDPPFSEGLSV